MSNSEPVTPKSDSTQGKSPQDTTQPFQEWAGKIRHWVCLWKNSFREGKWPLKSFFQVTLRDISPNLNREQANVGMSGASQRNFPQEKGSKGKGEMKSASGRGCRLEESKAKKVTGRISNGSLRHWKVDTNCGEIEILEINGEVQWEGQAWICGILNGWKFT